MRTVFCQLCVVVSFSFALSVGLNVAPVAAQSSAKTTIVPNVAILEPSTVVSHVVPKSLVNTPQKVVMLPSDIRVEVVNENDRRGPFAPYEAVYIGLVFMRPERYHDVLDPERNSFEFSSLSRINGKAFPSYLFNNFSYGSWCDEDTSKARQGVVFSQGFGPVGLLPRQPGTYRFNLVVKTSIGTWRVPQFDVTVKVPDRDRAAYQAFLRSGAKAFLESENGIRSITQVRSGQQALPYASVKTFVRRYKTSSLTKRVLERAKECWQSDAQQTNSNADEDSRQVAEIIAIIDPTSVVREAMAIQNSAKAMLKTASPSEKSNLQLQIAGQERWIKMILAAQKRV